jgi:hypothetical protein
VFDMSDDVFARDHADRDASDVVEGPVGSAHLKDPSTSGPIGADLEDLTPIDIPADEPSSDGWPIDRPNTPGRADRSIDRG